VDRVLDRLWIGATEDFRAPLATLGFSGVLDLRDNTKSEVLDVKVFRIGNRDGDPWTPEQVNNAIDFVFERVRHGNVLVACAAGMSRSACMVIGFLVRTGWNITEAYERVYCTRRRISPVPAMLRSVLQAVRS
jgi:protein-tyrosine phosphatase